MVPRSTPRSAIHTRSVSPDSASGSPAENPSSSHDQHPRPQIDGARTPNRRLAGRSLAHGRAARGSTQLRSSAAVDRNGSADYVTAMLVMPIIKLPDPILREVSKPVERVDDMLRRFIDDMLATMYAAPGIGLAAVQVGEPIRVLVVDVSARERKLKGGAAANARSDGKPSDKPLDLIDKKPICMINPRLLSVGDERNLHEEGCLSIPEVYAEIERPASVRVAYLDRDGKPREMDCDGVLATCVQHELDHLDGRLFIDHLGRLRRDMIIRKFVKAKRAEQV